MPAAVLAPTYARCTQCGRRSAVNPPAGTRCAGCGCEPYRGSRCGCKWTERTSSAGSTTYWCPSCSPRR